MDDIVSVKISPNNIPYTDYLTLIIQKANGRPYEITVDKDEFFRVLNSHQPI